MPLRTTHTPLTAVVSSIRYGKRDSIHAFVDKKTGEVYKPASTKAPAKGVRFRILDEASREDMLSRAGWSGGYLYVR